MGSVAPRFWPPCCLRGTRQGFPCSPSPAAPAAPLARRWPPGPRRRKPGRSGAVV